MPPEGYRTITVRADVIELIVRAKGLFHKSQIQILLEAVSEYINRHYEYGYAVLSTGVTDAVAVAWSAGVFESLGVAYRHPSPARKVAVEVASDDEQILSRLKDIWGGTLYKEKGAESEGQLPAGSWVWGLRSEKAKRFLEAALPYMKGGKRQVAKDCLSQPEETSARSSPATDVSRANSKSEN